MLPIRESALIAAAERTSAAPATVAGRSRQLLIAATVGVVLADSSIVTLALPDILRQFDTSVFGVSWVLTSFNIVLAAAVLPAAWAARGHPRLLWVGGLAAFGLASAVCAVAPSVAVLIAGRCVQALGGAAVIAGAIELLAAARGSHRGAAPLWGAAGLAGLAIGPAVGGVLTEALSWESIFALQVPVVVIALATPRAVIGVAVDDGPGRADVRPELALGLLSAGLTGALFLLVVMLTEGWGLTPIEAALVVSVMPAATLAGRALVRSGAETATLAAAGAVAMAGGLAALGLLPDAAVGWTVAPQLLVGVGIALALPSLTARALAGRDPAGRRAAGTIAARHAGIVIGIVLLTPVFSARLGAEHEAAQRAGTALLLDAPLSTGTKVDLGAAIASEIEAADGQLPDLDRAFAAVEAPPEESAELAALRDDLDGEVESAATHAFSLPFLLGGALALLALAPIAGRSWPRRGQGDLGAPGGTDPRAGEEP